MKRIYFIIGCSFALVFLYFTLYFIAHNVNAPGAKTAGLTKEIEVSKIYGGGVQDIVFETPYGDYYYINRGLEQGFTLTDLEEKLLNKSVTLHLTQKLAGISKHIHQLQVGDETIYSELN